MEVISGVNIEWTRYWTEDEKEEIRPALQKTLAEYPEFQSQKLTVGRTSTAYGRRPKDRDIKYSDRYYIQLNPEKAREFTVSHELQHILTREKAVDVRAMSRSPELITDSTSYLELPEEVEENLEEYRQVLYDIAVDVVSGPNDLPVAKEFEKRVNDYVSDSFGGKSLLELRSDLLQMVEEHHPISADELEELSRFQDDRRFKRVMRDLINTGEVRVSVDKKYEIPDAENGGSSDL